MSAKEEELLDSPLAADRSMTAVGDKAKEILPNIHINLDKQKSKKRKPSKKMVIIKKDKKEGGEAEPEPEPEPGEGPSDAGVPKPEAADRPQSPPGLYQPSGAVGPAFPPASGPKDAARAVPEAADIAAAAAALKPAQGQGPSEPQGAEAPKGIAPEPEGRAPEGGPGEEKDAPAKKTPRGRLARLFKGSGDPGDKAAGKKDGDAAPKEGPNAGGPGPPAVAGVAEKPEKEEPGQRAREVPAVGFVPTASSGAPAEPAKEADAPGEDPDKKGKKKKTPADDKGPEPGRADPQDPAAKLGDVSDAVKGKAAPAAAIAAAAVEPGKASDTAKSPKGKGKSPRVATTGEPSGKGPDDGPAEKKQGFGKKLSSLKGLFVPEDKDKGKKDTSPEEATKPSPKAVPEPAPVAAPGKSPKEMDVGSHPLDFGPSSSPSEKSPEVPDDKAKDAAAKVVPAVGAASATLADKAATPGKSPDDTDVAKRARELRLPEGAAGSPSAKAPEGQASEEKEAPTVKKSGRGLGKKLSNLGGRIFGGSGGDGKDKGGKPGSSEDVGKSSATEPPTASGPVAGKPAGSGGPTADKGNKEPSAVAAPAAALAAAAPDKADKPDGAGATPSDAEKDKGAVKTRELQHRPRPLVPEVDPAGAEEPTADKEAPKGVVGKTLSGLGDLFRSRGGAVPPKDAEEPVRIVDRACTSTDKKVEPACDSKGKAEAEPSAKGKGVVDGVPVGGPSVVTAKADKVPNAVAVSGSELGATPETAGKGGIPPAVQNVGVGAAFGALGLAFFLFGKRDDVDAVMEPEYICDSPWPIGHDSQWMQNWLWHAE